LYSSPDIIKIIKSRRVKWAGHVTRMGEKMNAYRISEEKPEGKIPLGTCKQTLGGRSNENWIHLAQDRGQWRAVVDTVMNLRVL
jgi:hypothetical protein